MISPVIQEETPPDRPSPDGSIAAHAVPFIAWIFLAHMLGDPSGWAYAARTLVCLGLLLWFRPWRWYPRLQVKNLGWAAVAGAGVFVLWVMGETAWAASWSSGLSRLYVTWGVLPFGELRPEMETLPYAPETCGWALTLVRLAGSAFVIAVIEEFFWRGFLFRWMQGGTFVTVNPAHFDRLAFFAVAIAFGLEHKEWLVGILTGFIYGWMYIRTRDIWAVAVAHVLTNFLLGLYVIKAGAWWFWA